jgi:hypothetical protein
MPSNASDPTATAGYCLAYNDRAAKSEKCGFSDNVFTTRWCDNAIDPSLIYGPISACSGVSAGGIHIWAYKWRVSRQIKWLLTIIGLLLPIVSLFLVQYLYQKGHFNSAATEQPYPENQMQLHAVEPVSAAEPHFNSAATEQPYPENQMQLHAVEPVSAAEPHFNSAATEQPYPENQMQLHAVEPVSAAEPQGP